MRILTSASLPAARPSRVTVTFGRRSETLELPIDGTLRFDSAISAIPTRSVTITVEGAPVRTSTSSRTGEVQLLPAGISELSFDGPAPLTGSSRPTIAIGCDAGLSMLIDGTRQPLAATATVSQLLQSQPLLAVPCRSTSLALGEGAHRLRLESTASLLASSVTMTRVPVAAASGQAQSRVLKWANTARTIEVQAAAQSVLVVRENYNAGWRATVGGRKLSPLMVNGWQQAWIVPAGTTGLVQLSFGPQKTFTAGLMLGLVAALWLLLLTLWPAGAVSRPLEPAALGQPFTRSARLLALAGPAVLGLLYCGWAGLVVALAVIAATLAIQRRGSALPWWVGAAVLIGVGLLARNSPLGHRGGWFGLGSSGLVQLGCLLAVLLALTSAFGPGNREPSRRPAKRRSSGRSMPNQDVAATAVAAAATPARTNQKLPENGRSPKIR